ncbi:MAG: alkaline phosphatase D family protein [Actinomycetota bacterium]
MTEPLSPSRRELITSALAGAGSLAFTPRALARRSNDVIFEDRFDRRNRQGWGRAWFNQRYARRWAIEAGTARYHLPPVDNNVDDRPNPVLILDHDVADIDIRTRFKVNNRTGRFGLVARAVGYSDMYAVLVGPRSTLKIVRVGMLKEKRLAQRKVASTEHVRYNLRFQVKGAGPVSLKAKLWPVGYLEPQSWSLEVTDTDAAALLGSGPFGFYFSHARDGRGFTAQIEHITARSHERIAVSRPSITYSLVGVPHDEGKRIVAVAKSAVPARIGFQYGTDPTFTNQTVTIDPVETRTRALTVKATFDLSILGKPTVVHWRAFATRKGSTTYGPASSFRLPQKGLPVRFGFGACTKWTKDPHRSFEQARLKLVDLFLHQGDFGYAPHRVIDQAPDTYQDLWTRLLSDQHLASLAREAPFTFYRDDADYGRNQSDRSTLRPFTIDAHGELNANPSNDPFEFRYGDIHFFSLDCRRYSTGKDPKPEDRSKLGTEQKRWLKDRMVAARDSGAALLVVASPQPFGSDATPGAWRRAYQPEWRDLIDFFEQLEAPVLIISGDAHAQRLYEFPQKALPSTTPRIVEFLSAGTEHSRFHDEVDPEFLLPTADAKEAGIGIVEVGPEQNVGGERTRTLTLTAVRTKDGSAMWRKNYVIVSGVGILPLTV